MRTTPLYPAEKYTYRVLWSAEDQQYVGRCTEFPDLCDWATTHDAALAGIVVKSGSGPGSVSSRTSLTVSRAHSTFPPG